MRSEYVLNEKERESRVLRKGANSINSTADKAVSVTGKELVPASAVQSRSVGSQGHPLDLGPAKLRWSYTCTCGHRGIKSNPPCGQHSSASRENLEKIRVRKYLLSIKVFHSSYEYFRGTLNGPGAGASF